MVEVKRGRARPKVRVDFVRFFRKVTLNSHLTRFPPKLALLHLDPISTRHFRTQIFAFLPVRTARVSSLSIALSTLPPAHLPFSPASFFTSSPPPRFNLSLEDGCSQLGRGLGVVSNKLVQESQRNEQVPFARAHLFLLLLRPVFLPSFQPRCPYGSRDHPTSS